MAGDPQSSSLDSFGDANVMSEWVALDLDGTLAEYHGWKGVDQIGDPVPAMVEAVKGGIEDGLRFEIFTARVSEGGEEAVIARYHIKKWLKENGLPDFEITATKKKKFRQFWDDRAVNVELNTGVINHG